MSWGTYLFNEIVAHVWADAVDHGHFLHCNISAFPNGFEHFSITTGSQMISDLKLIIVNFPG